MAPPSFLWGTLLLAVLFSGSTQAFRNYKVISVNHTVYKNVAKHSLVDVWKKAGQQVDFLVSPALYEQMRLSVDHDVVVDDVGASIDAEWDRMKLRERFLLGSPLGKFFDEYRDLEEYDAFIDSVVLKHPQLASVSPIGETSEGRTIRSLRLTSSTSAAGSSGDAEKRVVLLNGLIHAREWLGGMTTAYTVYQLVEQYGNQSSAARVLLDQLEFHVVLPLNRDGFHYTFSSKKARLWRKTRTINNGTTCIGIDGNRNFPFHWGASGVSENPCSEIYLGPKPLSTGCTIALDKLQRELAHRTIMYADIHAYVPSWTSVYGYTHEEPPEFTQLKEYMNIAVSAIRQVHGTRFLSGTAANEIGLGAGGTDDNCYSLGVVASFTVEVRGNSFIESPSQIVPSGQEVYAGIVALSRHLAGK